jgi:hydroxymethylglutaryl-CoA synthase
VPGIVTYGTYVPYHRLQRAKIGQALGAGGGPGARAVASYDENTTTMGVEAARRCLRSTDVVPEALYFASAAPAYLDKTNATAIHAALDLPSSVFAVDECGSQKSGIAAFGNAYWRRGPALAVCADVRVGLPGGADERDGGDAAAAFLLGDEPGIAEVIAHASATGEFLDRWRVPGGRASKVWEERFSEDRYVPLAQEAVAAALKQADLGSDQLDVAVVTGLAARAVRSVGMGLGVGPDKLADDLAGTVGNTGTAHPWLMLANVLDGAQPNQMIAVVILADGAEAIILRTTDAIAGHHPAESVAQQIAAGNDGLDYQKYLTWRGLLDREPPRRPDPERPAAPPSARSEHWKFGFVGSRDRSSGAIHLPPMRVSMQGGTVDDMEPIRMADVPATVATFTVDRLAFSLSPPVVAAVIDFDGGGRFQSEMTDVDPGEVKIGMRVEMTFRKLFEADGVQNYFWKAKPIRA